VSKVALRMRLSGEGHLEILIRHHFGVSLMSRKLYFHDEMEVGCFKKFTSPTKPMTLHKFAPLNYLN